RRTERCGLRAGTKLRHHKLSHEPNTNARKRQRCYPSTLESERWRRLAMLFIECGGSSICAGNARSDDERLGDIGASVASVVSVAASLGHALQSAFAAAFRRLTNETPSNWRRQRQSLRGWGLGCNSHCAGTSAGAPLSLIKSTRNFA